jgi:hypothetical protein
LANPSDLSSVFPQKANGTEIGRGTEFGAPFFCSGHLKAISGNHEIEKSQLAIG